MVFPDTALHLKIILRSKNQYPRNMKKPILFAILAFSMNVVAQNNHFLSNSPENLLEKTEHPGMKPPNGYAGLNLGRLIKNQPSGQPNAVQIMDSLRIWQWDTLSIAWKNRYKYKDISYDGHNNLTSYMMQSWNGSGWVNFLKMVYAFDASNNLTRNLYRRWTGSTWDDSFQFIYTYDASNNKTSELWQNWNGSAWLNGGQLTYTYDAKNNQTGKLYSNWNGTAWENIYQDTFTYNASDKQTSELRQNWASNGWVNDSQHTYTYFSGIYLKSQIYQHWENSVWVKSTQFSYTYDSGHKKTKELHQLWAGSSWVDYEQYLYTYDANNNLANELWQGWSSTIWESYSQFFFSYDARNNLTSTVMERLINGAWVNSFVSVSTYDVNNFVKGVSNKSYNDEGTVITSGDSTFYYFHTAAGIDDSLAGEGTLRVYPNPCNGKVTISSQIRINSVEVYTLSGERLTDFQCNRQTSEEIDLSGLIKGTLILKINTGKKSYNRKIIVQ